MPTYTRTNLKDAIWDPSIYSNIASRINVNNVMNEVVREIVAGIDLRSAKRRAATSPNLFDDVKDYAWPSDGKRNALVDVVPQIRRSKRDYWTLTTPEEFDRIKDRETFVAAIEEKDLIKKLRLSVHNDADQLVIATLDDVLGDGGEWVAYDTNTDTIEEDADNFVKGSGSVRFNITAVGGTTAGIKNLALDEYDYSDYVTLNRSVFVFAWITSAANITNYKLRLGQAAAYDEVTVTATNEGTAFRAGWNLLRFDLANRATTGVPDREAGDFAAIFMTKAAGKVSETAYRFDHISAQEGKYYDVVYYSKYGWQSSAGTYLENSTADTDLLNADADEFNLFVQQGRVRKGRLEKDWGLADREEKKYNEMAAAYKLSNPSEALIMSTEYQQI